MMVFQEFTNQRIDGFLSYYALSTV